MDKDNDKNINENNRLFAIDDFDFDEEYNKSKEEIKKPDIKVSISSSEIEELDGLNPNDDPSFFFDFRKLLKPYNYRFIEDNQHIFWDDCHFFSVISDIIIYNDDDFLLWIPVENHMHQSNIFRIYLERRQDKFLIPIIVSENISFVNLKEYRINENTANELCCYLSLMYQHLQDICTGKFDKHMFRLYNLIPLNKLIVSRYISEAFQLKPEDTGCSRCIWIDENRNTTHGPRIKVQHNIQQKSTKKWATLTINGEFIHDSDSDNKFKSNDKDLLLSFIRYNKDLISDLFYGKISDEDILHKFIKIDKNGNPIIKDKISSINKSELCDYDSIVNDLTICRRKSDRLMNVIVNDNSFMFDKWFDSIKFNKRLFRLELKSENWTKDDFYYIKK